MPLSRAVKNALAEAQARPVVASYSALRLARNVLETPEGDIPVKKIGDGFFTTAYREQGGKKRVFALSMPHVFDKQIAESTYDRHRSNPHLPAVQKYGSTAVRTVYAMPYYHAPLRESASLESWRDYRTLEDCFEEVYPHNEPGYATNAATLACARKRNVRTSVVEALKALNDTAENYSDQYEFEFHPKNLATDDDGNLVLLDVLADRKLVREVFRARAQERSARAHRESRKRVQR